MRVTHRNLAFCGAGLTVALALSACGSGDDGSSGSIGGMSHGPSISTSATAPTDQWGDVMFAQMMILHHQQAIEMADLALGKGSASSAVMDLARQVKGAQDPEIQIMNGWLREWGASAPTSSMGHGGTGGMMSDNDMKMLADADGSTFDRMWLTMMIQHHGGAVAMAEDVLKTTADTDVKTLAQAIIEGQNKEIATMRGLL